MGWPTIGKTSTGELIVVFSGDREGHICPYGKTQLIRSADAGATWSEPVTINNTPFDDRDAGLLITRDGTFIVSWFTLEVDPDDPMIAKNYPESTRDRWRSVFAKITDADRAKWVTPNRVDDKSRGHWIRRSTDNGKSWGEAIAVAASTPHGPIELASGRLLYVGNESYERKTKTSKIVAEISDDIGESWEVIGCIDMFPDAAGAYLGEPHVVEVEPDRLVAMFRHERAPYIEGREDGFLWQSASDDGGQTWSKPFPTPIWGKPPHLLRLKNGTLLVTYGHRREPYGERACLSYDGGKSWDIENEIILRDDAPPRGGDLGYPASVELDDGSIMSVYYQPEKPGEKPCVMATHWRLADS